MTDLYNWAGNYRYQAARIHTPQTVTQLQELITGCRKLRVLGTRHSFNSIADTPEDLISFAHFDKILALDTERHTVTVEAGIKYGTLCRYLNEHGYALPNLASLPHISVGGACATATHGSGSANGCLATAVAALELVTGNGDVRTLSREHDAETFAGTVIGLGGLGAVTKLTLNLLPAFTMRQVVYENLPMAQVENHFAEIMGAAYSVSLFTDWQSENFTQVWQKHRVTDDTPFAPEPVWFEATRATRPLHPLAHLSAENCTEQQGIPGPWYERLPHFRMDFTPSSGEELQSEYLLPRQHAVPALHSLAGIREHIAPLLQVSEIRTVAADDFWMSPFYRQDGVGIHFTWLKDWPAVKALLPEIEARLAPFQARPHWGKLFTTEPTVIQSLYPKLPDFRRLLAACDPEGKFRNPFLDTSLF